MPTASALGFTETQAKNQFAANRESLIGNYDRVLTKAQYAEIFKLIADGGNQANWPTAREISANTGYSVQAAQTVIDEVIAGGKEYKRLNP
jgi:hypothetical protein